MIRRRKKTELIDKLYGRWVFVLLLTSFNLLGTERNIGAQTCNLRMIISLCNHHGQFCLQINALIAVRVRMFRCVNSCSLLSIGFYSILKFMLVFCPIFALAFYFALWSYFVLATLTEQDCYVLFTGSMTQIRTCPYQFWIRILSF